MGVAPNTMVRLLPPFTRTYIHTAYRIEQQTFNTDDSNEDFKRDPRIKILKDALADAAYNILD